MRVLNFLLTLALVQWSLAQTCSHDNGKLRLVGGVRNGEGRLLAKGGSGQWGSVCPDRWATRNAGVACEELCGDRKYATSVPAAARFGPGAAIRIFNTSCAGYESSMLHCPHVESGDGNCFEDAGVGLCCHSGCDGRNLFLAPRLRYSARCDLHSYTVWVQNAPPSLGGVVYPFDIAPYNDPNCFDAQTGHNLTHKWMTVPFGKCGVQQESINNGDYIKHKQDVLISGQTTGPAITRLFRWKLPVSCGVNRKTNASEWIGSGPPIGGEEDLPPVNGSNSLDMSLTVFEDPLFTKQLPLPVVRTVGTPVYVKLAVDRKKLQIGDAKAKIVVEKCSAFPLAGAATNLHHTVIDRQLSVDDGTDIFKSPELPEVRFKMQLFKIGIQYRELYLTCSGYICPTYDRTFRCTGPPANGQHTPGANMLFEASVGFAAAGDGHRGSLGVESGPYGVETPRFRPGSFGPDDFPNAGLGPDEYLRVGRDDGKYYHFKADGSIRLFRGTGNRP